MINTVHAVYIQFESKVDKTSVVHLRKIFDLTYTEDVWKSYAILAFW